MKTNNIIVKAFNCIPNVSILVTPLVLSPLIVGVDVSTESKCAFLILLIATLWTFNPIPLPITSMFPIVLLPLLSLASTETACSAYLKGNNMLFLGCLTLALAVEKSNLHQRVALKVLLSVSTQFQWILLTFMLTTTFFSMWLVSTATVAMMLPIADEIFNNLFSSFDELNENKEDSLSMVMVNDDSIEKDSNNGKSTPTGEEHELIIQASKAKVRKMFYLCIAYAATIGSVSTLTSNGPNLIMKDILEEHYENRDPVDYASWLIFAAPVSIMITVICWQVFYLLYFRKVTIPEDRREIVRKHISKKYERLGPMTFHECAVLFIFVVMILLYIMYKPQFFDGWLTLFNDTKTAPKMASAAIFCVLLLFLIPAKPSWNPDLKQDALLDWHTIQTKLEWGVLFIRGGGFAIADAVKTSGLSHLVGTQLSMTSNYMSTSSLIVSLSILANLLIEFMRSSATASVIIPVTINLAESLNINPLKIIIPMVTSCAYAFITPVGTTTNTLIYYHGNLSITEMIIPGIIAKTISIIVMTLNIHLFGNLIFGIDNNQPNWLVDEHIQVNGTLY